MQILRSWRDPTRVTARRLLLLILIAGAFFRLVGLNWDKNHHLHPDERFLSMVEEALHAPSSIGQYFNSAQSTLNPYNRGHDSFVYGTLPMFLAKGVGGLLKLKGYDGTFFVGRAFAALFDLLSVWLVYRIVRRFAGRATALLGAGLLAFCPLGIQQSHFWTVDPFLATCSTAALLGAVRLAQGGPRLSFHLATGAAVGLAVACKVTGLALLFPVGVAILIGVFARRDPPADRSGPLLFADLAARSLAVLAGMAIAVRIALPYAFLGPNPLSFRLDPRWVNDLKRLTSLSTSVAGYPPNFQWAGRTPLFPVKNMVLWGMGPFFGLAAVASLVWFAVAVWKRRRLALLPLLLHVLFLLAYHGLTMVKSIRYLYPAYPALAVLASLFLADLASRQASGGFAARVLRILPATAFVGTFLCAIAMSSIYRHEHPRITATRWIYENEAPPKRVLNETWDDGLPMPMPGYDSGQYSGPQVNFVGPDNSAKVEEIVKALEGSDVIAITSNRAYGTLTRVPDVFPMTRAYYKALFEERLGFDWVGDFSSYPSLGPLHIPDDSSDEAFTVYDHPRVLLFRRNQSFSSPRVRKTLLAALPAVTPTLGDWERWPRSQRRVTAALVPPHRADLARAEKATVGKELPVGSFAAAILWYLVIAVVGLLALPLAHRLFPRLSDRGYGFARILGLAVATYALTASVQFRLLANGRSAALLALAVLAAFSAALGWGRRAEIRGFLRGNAKALLAGEIAFAVGFLLFLGIRALNPEITWGEKPMDFSILNILVRTRGLPASDPWFSGAPLSYYTFGHQIIAMLTLLTGLSTRYTFNLAFGLLGGVTMQGAFSLARSWGGSLRSGVAGAAMTAIIGNLAGLREWLINKRHLDWDYFWATSRVLPNTINEYPIWSLTFADLHAHVLAMPLILLLFACALQFVRTHTDPGSRLAQRLLHASLLGGSAAFVALTNAWDVPLLAGLLPLVAVMSAWSDGRFSFTCAGRAAIGYAVALATFLLAVLPVSVRSGALPGYGRNMDEGRGVDILTVFGLFFFIAYAVALSFANRRMAESGLGRLRRWGALSATILLLVLLGVRSVDAFLAAGVLFFLYAAVGLAGRAEERLAFGFISAAFFLVFFAQRFYIIDRMNTFFKLYFETWLLLAVSTAVLAFGGREREGTFRRWPLPARGVFVLLAIASLFTSVTGVAGALGRHYGAYSGPSLDGLRYLEESRPGEYLAVNWMRNRIRGTPVTLEAQGASYQDFGRISMFTGLPTVLGWDYHVKQRGNPDTEIEARKRVVEQIYASPNPDSIEGPLRRYHVGYVYVGWLERKTYPSAGLKKFDAAKSLFSLAYENRESKIYRVVGGETEDVILVTRESLPVVAKAEVQGDEPEEAPSIAETAATDRPPFSGMRQPRGAAVDGKGRLWVADLGNNRLRVFDLDGGFLGGWGGRGNGTYGLREPNSLAIGGEDLYIADTWNGRVEYFTLAGESKGAVTGLFGPRGVAASASGPVWATDTGNNRLVRYNRMLGEPKIVGEKGAGPGKFSGPVGIAVGPSGSVYVADVGNRRIQALDAEGNFVSMIPFPGWTEWCEAYLEVGKDETLYVTDPVKNTVFQFDRRGSVLKSWTAEDSGQAFSRPTGVAVDRKRDILYVINSASNSVGRCKLSEKKTP